MVRIAAIKYMHSWQLLFKITVFIVNVVLCFEEECRVWCVVSDWMCDPHVALPAELMTLFVPASSTEISGEYI
jgi:hypothetical protein